MRRRPLAPFPVRHLFAVMTAVAAVGALGTAFAAPNADASSTARYDTATVLVQLTGEPLATSPKTRPVAGRKIDFNNSNVKSQRAQLSALRNDYKAWLRANVPGAKVTGEFDLALNAVAVTLNGATLAQVAASPLVTRAEYQGLYRPSIADPDLGLIEAGDAWQSGGGPALAGAGVKVAIVDSGIDVRHPCFADAGYPAQQKSGPSELTNNKVIVAKVFNNKSPSQKYTPAPAQEHGTHVAGTVACNYRTAATVSGVDIPYGISGVAPRALLGNYNVFPGDVEDARSEDILNALEAAYTDGFDVANMSLGGGANGFQDLLTHAVDNLDVANMVVAVAAGNSGPGLFTVESPGSAARALTAGASSVPHFIGAPVTALGTTYGAASGDFALVKADLTAPLGVVTKGAALDTACAALPAASLTGKIALVARGDCFFTVKIRNAQAAGAVAVLVGNNVAGDPTAMGTDGTASQPTIPAYMVSRESGVALQAAAGQPATIGATLAYIGTDNENIMAGFSSQGPTDVDLRVKPDVVAPGVNVLSSIPAAFCGAPPCFAFLSGTSMATPHLAGSAAVVRQQKPTWSAAQVRSAVINTAVRGALFDYSLGLPTSDPMVTGAGLENLDDAVRAAVALDPVSISFGAVPSGSGRTKSVAVAVTNLSGVGVSWSLGVGTATGTGVTYSVSPSGVTIAAGGTVNVLVTMSAEKGAAVGGHAAWLDIVQGGVSVAHAAVYSFVK